MVGSQPFGPLSRYSSVMFTALPLRLIFGGTWIRLGGHFLNLRGGLGRYSGRVLACLRSWLRGSS